MLKQKQWYCYDCRCHFQIISTHPGLQKPHCPKCGDNINVSLFIGQNRKNRKPWSAEEMVMVDEVLQGKRKALSIAHQTGRTVKAVHDQISKRRLGRV